MATKKKKSLNRKDRIYVQKGKRSASLSIRTSHTPNNPLQWVDSDGVPRSLRYCTNQKSIFMDEQEGDVLLGRVTMFDGALKVDSNNMVLQEFLSKHPHNGVLFEEFDPEKKAEEEFEKEEFEFKAKKCVFDSTSEQLSSLGLSILGSKSKKLTTSELKRDLLVEANRNPELIIELFNDEDLQLIALSSDALSHGLLTYKSNKIYSDDEVVLEVPFGEDAEDTLKSYMKTKDGNKLEKYLKSKLK
ncbi:MAG: hypothetical protein ACTHY0_02280 [Mammaliicoccus vitulinus]